MTKKHGDPNRTLYTKYPADSDNGLLSPWDGGVEWDNHPWNPPPPKYKQELSTEVRWSTNAFHLHEGTNPKGSLKNCLEECNKRYDCKGIVIDTDGKCWGKRSVPDTRNYDGRTLYEKSDNGLLSPWDGGVEWDIHPWNESSSSSHI